MLKLLTIALTATLAITMKSPIVRNRAFKPFLGSYYVVYQWPNPDEICHNTFPDCRVLTFKKYKYKHGLPYVCRCTRHVSNLALVKRVEENKKSYPLLVDIIYKPIDFKAAVNNNCVCDPVIGKVDAVFRKLDYGCFIYHENDIIKNVTNSLLMCKTLPVKFELKELLVEDITEVKATDGKQMCVHSDVDRK